ncbi:hypothetical protein ACO1O0_005136 [Amphichorda felina]
MAYMAVAIALTALASPATASTFYSALSLCPLPCSISGPDPANWTHYHDTRDLSRCQETTLFTLNIHNPVDDPDTQVAIRACSTSDGESGTWSLVGDRGLVVRRQPSLAESDEADSVNEDCGKTTQAAKDIQFARWGTANSVAAGEVAKAASQLSQYLKDSQDCKETILFSLSGGTILGTYAGSGVSKASASDLIKKFGDQSKDVGARSAAQLCSSFGPTTFGIVADTTGNLSSVQKSLAGWKNATCLTGYDADSTWSDTKVSTVASKEFSVTSQSHGDSLSAQATCKYTQVQAREGCWSLAERCGISETQLKKYNSKSDFCDTLQADQYVCCSSGSLPDFSPQPGKDGSCFAYQVASGDTCASIAEAHTTTVKLIESVNDNTWGWMGCKRIMDGQKICLSKGDPPMPASIPNAICGPQKPGTETPSKGTNLADLNPCPLNSCCNIWGQCGITPAFCTPSPADTGAPGTAKPGSNGCVSHCGTNITYSKDDPATPRYIGYFEAWNQDRPCLNMMPSSIPSGYADVHFAFANITTDYKVDVSGYQKMFDEFVQLEKPRRIISFGGWAFSTEINTAPIFREGVTDTQRESFATNVVNFVKEHKLDGVDFDWEYPGAPDIPGIPAGDPEDGNRYLAFLKLVKKALPEGKSVSIAAPASYWYLKGFPIKSISEVVDYIVYMTYDLHGQWDYGNEFVNEGCPNGNCLRSHVNMTETNYSLAMITKAGVPSNKVVIGMPTYGRSFEMTKAGCRGPECTFTGPKSGAWPGKCTNTSGYISNWEIRQLVAEAESGESYITAETFVDEVGDVVILNDNQWISWLGSNSYIKRLAKYKEGNWAGTVEWAIDLNWSFDGANGDDQDSGDWWDIDPNAEPVCDLALTFDSIEDLSKHDDDPYCMGIYAMEVLAKDLRSARKEYDEVNKDYDELFKYYEKYIKKIIPTGIDNFMLYEDGYKYFECSSPSYDGNKTHSCSEVGKHLDGLPSYTLYLTATDEKGFFENLQEKFGIVSDWVKFGKRESATHCNPSEGGDECEDTRTVAYGAPLKADKIEIPNPKDIITKSGESMSSLDDRLTATWMDMMLGQWDGDGADTALVSGLPVSMIKQAIESMKQVKKIGETEKEEEQKELILTIVGAVLAVVPFVGEGTAALAGLAGLGRMIFLAGEASNAVFTVYSVVDNPESALMSMFGMLLGAGSLPRTGQSFKKMNQKRNEASADGTLAKMGGIIAEDTRLLEDIMKVKVCKK